MNTAAKEALVIVSMIFLLFAIIVLMAVGTQHFIQQQTDQYCKTTPLDRIDKERCNIQ